MKTNKRGISLIVLVITIIVIIILAAAVILTLNNNNPIENANEATFKNDKAELQSAVALFVANFMAKNNGLSPFVMTSGTITFGDEDRVSDGTVDNTPMDKLGWGDLGLEGMPSSMTGTVTVDVATGIVSCTQK